MSIIILKFGKRKKRKRFFKQTELVKKKKGQNKIQNILRLILFR
jgi:hypothetical protein